MNILITGGLGFIGTSLTKELIHNQKVFVLDINCYENTRNLNSDKVTYLIADVCAKHTVLEFLSSQKVDGIIHLAAVSRVVIAENNPEECIRTNIGGIENLLECLKATNQKPWLIFGSSREVYGEPTHLPVCENDTLQAANLYGKTKISGEKMFRDYAQENMLSCAILRFSNVYGNKYDLLDRVLPRFIKAIEKDQVLSIEGGTQIIDFTYIDDTVQAIIKTIDYLCLNPGIINDFHILPGIGWTLQQAIGYLEKIYKKKALVKINTKRHYDVQKFIGNPTKAKTILHLGSFTPLENGLELAAINYQEAII
jgi:nucleoside-diphosphate-sugar epimerase